MSEHMEDRLNKLDKRLEQLVLLCREREQYLCEQVRNHRVVVCWKGFSGAGFTKDLFTLELR